MQWWKHFALASVCVMLNGCGLSGPTPTKPRASADPDEPARPVAAASAPKPAAPPAAAPLAPTALANAAVLPPPPVANVPPVAAAAVPPPGAIPAAPVPQPMEMSETDRRKRTINQLREISRALEAYRERNGMYPARAGGRIAPISWRVLLLPFLGQATLYGKLHLDEPWDSPHNRKLLSQIPDVYRSAEHNDERTNFLIVTGPNTAYATSAGLESWPDGFDNTAFVVEVADDLAQPWSKPDDYKFEPTTAQRDLFGLRKDCCFVVLGGKSGPRRLRATVADNDLLALFSPAGGETLDLANVAQYPYPEVERELITTLEQSPVVRFAKGHDQAAPAPGAPAASAPHAGGTPRVGGASPAARAVAAETRAPVPDQAELAQAAAGFKDVFGAEFEAARRPEQRRLFARKMLAEGDKMAADKTSAFVLYRAARDVAAPAGDLQTALKAIEKLGANYQVDPEPMKAKAVEQAAPLLASESDARCLFDTALELADLHLAKDDFTAAQQLLALGGAAARRAGAADHAAFVAAKLEEVQLAKAAYNRVSQQMHALVRDANDPAANTAVGLYCCLTKRDWKRGVEMLARGSDERLAKIAQHEQSAPASAEAQVQLGDAWWDFAEERHSDRERACVRQHAAAWYEQALPQLAASLAKARVEKRIAAAQGDAGPLQAANHTPR